MNCIRRVGLTLGLAGTLACSSPPPPPLDAPHPMDTAYLIGAGDQLSVKVWKNPELSVDVPVRPDGMISVPLLDDVRAAGLTTEELKELVTRELGEFVVSPDVTIVVTSTGSKRAFIIGGVLRSGPISLATDTRVTDAIAAAGGFGAFASKDDIRIIRRQPDGGETEYEFDYDAYIKGKAPGTNLVLLPGDTVVVSD